MRNFWRLAVFLSAFMFSGPALASNLAWMLEQTSDMSGKQSLIWKDNAVRVSFEKLGLIAVAKAPSWKFEIFSPNSKRFCEYTYDQFRTKFGQQRERQDKHYKLLKNGKTVKICGLNTRQYTVLRSKKSGALDWTDRSEAWLTKDLIMPAVIGNLLAEIASLPKDLGIPLRVTRVRNRGITVRTIETLAYHRLPTTANTFNLPPGYKRVKDELAVLMEDDMEALLDQQADYLSRQATKRENISTTKGK